MKYRIEKNMDNGWKRLSVWNPILDHWEFKNGTYGSINELKEKYKEENRVNILEVLEEGEDISEMKIETPRSLLKRLFTPAPKEK